MAASKAFLLVILPILYQIILVLADDDCKNYHVLDMKVLQRHVDFTIAEPDLHSYICDDDTISSNFWYRLVHENVNYQIPNYCLPLESCGTFVPIWMVGDYPTQGGTIQNGLCANYGDTSGCQCTSLYMDGKVDIKTCEDAGHGGSFFIHKFTNLPGCPSGICAINGQHDHHGDLIKCDTSTQDCSIVTIVVDQHVKGQAYCNFKSLANSNQNIGSNSAMYTTTSVQCSVPTLQTGDSSTVIVYDRYEVNIYDTENGVTTTVKNDVEVLIYDSDCHICGNTGFCAFKEGKCLINGQCCQGNQCLNCDTNQKSTTSSTSSTSTPTTTDKTTTASENNNQDTTTSTVGLKHSTTTNEQAPSGDPDGSERIEPPDNDNTLYIVIGVIVAILVVLSIIMIAYIIHIRKKKTRVNNQQNDHHQAVGSAYLVHNPDHRTDITEASYTNNIYDTVNSVDQRKFYSDTSNPAYMSNGEMVNGIHGRHEDPPPYTEVPYGATGIDYDTPRYRTQPLVAEMENKVNDEAFSMKKMRPSTDRKNSMLTSLVPEKTDQNYYDIPSKIDINTHHYDRLQKGNVYEPSS